jgi:hypothetical protein
MDQEKLLLILPKPERQVAEGKVHIARQASLLRGLEQDGRDIAEARSLLSRLVDVQDVREHNLDRIKRELGLIV